MSEWPLAKITISQAPRECIPVLRAAGLESIKGSSPLPSAGDWGTSLEDRGVGSNPISASRFPPMKLRDGQQQQPLKAVAGIRWESKHENAWPSAWLHSLTHSLTHRLPPGDRLWAEE